MKETILCWDKPKKARTTEEHNKKYSSDSGVDGTYVPNMSEKDMLKWKAKHIKGDDTRVEIRKTAVNDKRGNYSQMLIVVRPDGSLVMSGNGKADVKASEFIDAIIEAREVLQENIEECPHKGTKFWKDLSYLKK